MIQNNTFCDRATNYFFNSTATFCAGDGKGKRDTCNGDSGGSMVRNVLVNGRRRWVTVGLVSWGEGCAVKGKYGYYTRLQPFLDWIRHTMNDSISSCGYPGNIPHGRLIGVNFSVGSRVRYKCISGYRLKGKSGRKCKVNGRWTRPPTCVKETACPDPGHPRNGIRRPTRSRYPYRAKLFFQCSRNHVITGKSTLYCRRDGTWNGHAPLCLAPCLVPAVPKNGVRLGTNFKHGQIVRFRCNKDFRMNGSSFIICSNGKWNNDSPKCYNGICDNPGSPYNGWRNGNDFFEGKQVTFTCKQNYDLIGLQAIQCLGTGRWSGPVPVCKRRCSYNRTPNSQTRSNTVLGSTLKHGTTLNYSCQRGYTLVGQPNTRCDNGRWSPGIPQCKASCSDPGPIQHGQKIGNTFTHSSVVSYVCNDGYTLDRSSPLRCNDGRWDRPVPICTDSCRDPVVPPNGRRNGNSFKHGHRVSYTCRRGTQLVGSSRLTCNNGRWSSEVPRCLEICNDPSSPVNGYKRGKSVSLSGDKITFYCDSKYDLVGSKEMFCDKGRWNGSVPRCSGRCKVPNYFGKLQITSRVALWRGDWHKHGTKLTFYCSNRQELVGKNETVCNNGHWSIVFPECKVPCKAPDDIPNGRKQGSKFKVEFECNPGHTLVGPSTIHCVQGIWNQKPPRCLGNCKDLGDIINGKKTGTGYKHGDRTSFQCKVGYRLEGNPSLECKNGHWSDKTPTCIGVCKILDTPQNAEMLNYNFDYGATVRFRCKIGFSLRGPRNLTCNNGIWSKGKVPVCKANCVDPGAPKDGQRQADVFSHDSFVNFTCNNELMLIGSSRIQCRDGRWTNRKPVCEECGSPLGMESRKIPDTNIRASSRKDWYHSAKYGRLNNAEAWCSAREKSPYLEIDLGKPYKITFLATQGSATDKNWVTKYTVSHTLAKSSFIEYRENKREKLFTGNIDATSVAKHKLKEPFIARTTRFSPLGLAIVGHLFSRACLRVEIYGCGLPNDCVMVGSRVLGKWAANYHGGHRYYKAYVKTIGHNDVQLDLEDRKQHSDVFKTLPKSFIVLDVPPKREELRKGTRVLAPWSNIYYSATIKQIGSRWYLVRADDNDEVWFTIDKIRRLKVEQFCG